MIHETTKHQKIYKYTKPIISHCIAHVTCSYYQHTKMFATNPREQKRIHHHPLKKDADQIINLKQFSPLTIKKTHKRKWVVAAMR